MPFGDSEYAPDWEEHRPEDMPPFDPEPIDDDPWDTPYAHPDPPQLCMWGVTPDHPRACGLTELCPACAEYHLGTPSDAL